MIRQQTLKQYGEKQVVVLAGDRTLLDAFRELHARGYDGASAYLVVTLPGPAYRVARYTELAGLLSRIGEDGLQLALADLPLASSSRTDHVQTQEGGKQIVDWVNARLSATAVAYDDIGFVGLFAGRLRSSLTENLSLLELPGDLPRLGEHILAELRTHVKPPECEFCHNRDFFTYMPGARKFVCRKCGLAQP